MIKKNQWTHENIKLEWQEHDLDYIVRFFAEGFKPGPGKKIVRYEYSIDQFKRLVTFRLFIEKGKV